MDQNENQVSHEMEILQGIKATAESLSAKMSKRSGSVKASEVKDVRVLGLNKWRKKEGGAQGSQDPFQKCLPMGLSFLDAPDDPPVPSAPADPDVFDGALLCKALMMQNLRG